MSDIIPDPADVVCLSLSVGEVCTVLADDEPYIVFRPAVESVGLDYPRQLKKIKERSWANRGLMATVAEDGKIRQMVIVDVKTFLMWLATVNERKVSEEARPTLIAYQAETMHAVHGYWMRGGAINPRATSEQLEALQTKITEQAHAIKALAPDAHAYRMLIGTKLGYDMQSAANILNQDPNIHTGRNRLFAKLRNMGILMKNNKPYASKKKLAVEQPDEHPWVTLHRYPGYYDPVEHVSYRGKTQTLMTFEGLKCIHQELGGVAPLFLTDDPERTK